MSYFPDPDPGPAYQQSLLPPMNMNGYYPVSLYSAGLTPPSPTPIPTSLTPGHRPRSASMEKPDLYTSHPPSPASQHPDLTHSFERSRSSFFDHSTPLTTPPGLIKFPLPELPSANPRYLTPGVPPDPLPHPGQSLFNGAPSFLPHPAQSQSFSDSEPPSLSSMEVPSFGDLSESPSSAESEEMRVALELSIRESELQNQKVLSEEEEELERALRASLQISTAHDDTGWEEYDPAKFATPVDAPAPSEMILSLPETDLYPQDSGLHRQVSEDEALARQLALEGIRERESASFNDAKGATPPLSPALPQYEDVVASNPPQPIQGLGLYPQPVQGASPSSTLFAPLTRSTSVEPVPTSTLDTQIPGYMRSQSVSSLGVSRAPPWRPYSSYGSDASSHFSTIESYRETDSEAESSVSASARTRSSSLSSSSLSASTSTLTLESTSEEQEEARSSISSASSIFRMPPAQVVEHDLIRGVSLAFTPPAISSMDSTMPGPIPNIISLPYGKCPPLHIMAPSWRQLLKLMARLSGTRLEATVEAIADHKSDLKLRCVIQFVKVHHSSSDWKTILYLTIDHPVPNGVRHSFKYTTGDVSTLPYSYTLSSLPTLLRDGPESEMAKSYTIPPTGSTSYPTLPISFPTLAMYLHSALEDSRRAVGESAAGVRKLAKLVDACYPQEYSAIGVADDALEEPERGGVRSVLKKVMGRGSKGARVRVRGGNADTYELVTPFRLDEYEEYS